MSNKKLLDRVTSTFRDELLVECGGICSVPRCSEKIWDLFPLDGNSSNLTKENLLGLCHVHFPMAGKSLNINMLRTIRVMLNRDRFPKQSGTFKHLTTREEYLAEVVRHIWTTEDELYIQYVGPLCLHPDWCQDRRDSMTKLPNMDRPIREFVRAHSHERTSKIRLVFRNAPRYRDKVNEVVREHERERFKADVIDAIDTIWGQYDRGPDVCCLETGFLHIPVIFKNVAITSSRTAANSPIQEGAIHLDKEVVELEKGRFNKLFDSNFRGLSVELGVLKDFIIGLWG
jgi:hypothetical protein